MTGNDEDDDVFVKIFPFFPFFEHCRHHTAAVSVFFCFIQEPSFWRYSCFDASMESVDDVRAMQKKNDLPVPCDVCAPLLLVVSDKRALVVVQYCDVLLPPHLFPHSCSSSTTIKKFNVSSLSQCELIKSHAIYWRIRFPAGRKAGEHLQRKSAQPFSGWSNNLRRASGGDGEDIISAV